MVMVASNSRVQMASNNSASYVVQPGAPQDFSKVQVRGRTATAEVYGIHLKGPQAVYDAGILKKVLILCAAVLAFGLFEVLFGTIYSRQMDDWGEMTPVELGTLLVSILLNLIILIVPLVLREKPSQAKLVFKVLGASSICCSCCTLFGIVTGLLACVYLSSLCGDLQGAQELTDDGGDTRVVNCTSLRSPLFILQLLCQISG